MDMLLKNNDVFPSRFNITFKHKGAVILFNSYSSAYLRIKANSNKAKALLSLGSDQSWQPIKKSPLALTKTLLTELTPHMSSLFKGNFIVPENIDERKRYKVRTNATRFSNKILALTITVTHQCNFNCDYCYEDKVLKKMDIVTQDALVNFIKNKIEGVKFFTVTWFGGEPLMAQKVIKRLSEKIITMCSERSITYRANIVTNGYLLTAKLAKELQALSISSAQITLDGAKDAHNKRRHLISGRATFDKIMENISNALAYMNISIRMNVDKENIKEAYRLIDFLVEHQLQKKMGVYFAAIDDEGKGNETQRQNRISQSACSTGGCNSCGQESAEKPSVLFMPNEFSTHLLALNEYKAKKGFLGDALPSLALNVCVADIENGYVIEPNGTIQKCWNMVTNPDEIIGDVFNGVQLNKNHTKWLDFDPFSIEKCSECRILPLCLGACPQKTMDDPSFRTCNPLKYTLVEDLKLYYDSRHSQSPLITTENVKIKIPLPLTDKLENIPVKMEMRV